MDFIAHTKNREGKEHQLKEHLVSVSDTDELQIQEKALEYLTFQINTTERELLWTI